MDKCNSQKNIRMGIQNLGMLISFSHNYVVNLSKI